MDHVFDGREQKNVDTTETLCTMTNVKLASMMLSTEARLGFGSPSRKGLMPTRCHAGKRRVENLNGLFCVSSVESAHIDTAESAGLKRHAHTPPDGSFVCSRAFLPPARVVFRSNHIKPASQVDKAPDPRNGCWVDRNTALCEQ